MKQSSQNILKLASEQLFTDVLLELSLKIPSYGINEYTMPELVKELNVIREVIRNVPNTEIIDEIAYNKRNGISNALTQIQNNANNIKAWGFNIGDQNVLNAIQAIFSSFYILQDQIESSSIYLKVLESTNLKTEVEALSNLKNQYLTVLAEVDLINKSKVKIDGYIEEIKNINEKAASDTNLITANKIVSEENLSVAAKNTEESILLLSKYSKDISELLEKIKKTEEEIESKKLRINTFHTNVDELENRNINKEIKVDEFIEKIVDETKETIKNNTAKTDKIVLENETLQERIKQLLQGANAGELFQAFELRKNQVKQGLNWWMVGIITTTVCIVGMAIWVSYTLKDSSAGIEGMVLVKIFSAIPLFILDVFLVNQYNKRRNLEEEYAFRAAISLSFLAYRDIIEQSKTNIESMKFIIDTVQKIYESPFDKQKLSKSQIRIFEKYIDKGVGIAGSFTSKK